MDTTLTTLLCLLVFIAGVMVGRGTVPRPQNPRIRATIMPTLDETKNFFIGVKIETTDKDGQPTGSQILHGDALKLEMKDQQNNVGTLELDTTVNKWRLKCGDISQGPASATITGTYTFGDDTDKPVDGEFTFDLGVGEAVGSHGSFELEEAPEA